MKPLATQNSIGMVVASMVLATGSVMGDPAMANEGRQFFSDADRVRIQQAAETEWGRPIVDALEKAVAERLEYDLTVPEVEAGHFHHYFCPDHKRLLEFDWDCPTEHFCVECDDYLTGERYDHAWVRFIHYENQYFLNRSTLLHILTGEEIHLERIRDMLLDYGAKYPHYELHGHDMQPAPYGGRMFSQSLDEATWVVGVAPAFVEALPILSAEEAHAIEEGLFRPCAEVIYNHRAGGNWQVWHNAGLACIGVALGDGELVRIAIDDPNHGYHHMMDTGVTADGWWDEGSPTYHFYPLDAMLITADAVRARGIDLFDDRLHAMFTAPLNALYPDLTFVAHNDGWHGVSIIGQASLYERAARRFDDPDLRRLLAHAYAQSERKHWTALLHGIGIEPDPTPLQLESYYYPHLGVAFLRDGTRTVVFKFGPHGGGHGHPDKLSIALHDGDRELVPDLGTSGYGVPDHTAWYARSLSHSTVVVDRRDQQPTTGRLASFFPSESGGRVEATCDTAYDGVAMRRTLDLNDGVLEDAFTCTSDTPRVYEYILILKERPEAPEHARPADLPPENPHGRISNAVSWDVEEHATLQIGEAQLELMIPNGPVTVTMGDAPGIPGNPWDDDHSHGPSHPLIIRTEGPDMTVRARWTFPEK